MEAPPDAPFSHLDLRLLASKNLRKLIPVLETTQWVVFRDRSPKQMNAPALSSFVVGFLCNFGFDFDKY